MASCIDMIPSSLLLLLLLKFFLIIDISRMDYVIFAVWDFIINMSSTIPLGAGCRPCSDFTGCDTFQLGWFSIASLRSFILDLTLPFDGISR